MSSPFLVYDDPTLAAYRRHAEKAIANWGRSPRPSRFLRRFAQALPPGGRVLDYGCGIGTDLAWLQRHRLRVEGLDGSQVFVREAQRRCPGVRIIHARFETARVPPARYHGIWCHAALIHVPPEALRQQLARLRQALRPGGLLGLTLAWGRRKGLTQRDWIPGRYIAAYTKVEALGVLRSWRILDCRVISHDGRTGRWIQILASPIPHQVQ